MYMCVSVDETNLRVREVSSGDGSDRDEVLLPTQRDALEERIDCRHDVTRRRQKAASQQQQPAKVSTHFFELFSKVN